MSESTRRFAERLMRDVWIPFDASRVSDFYHRDAIGHHRQQIINYQDVVNRLAWDVDRYGDQVYDIRDIVAEADKFAIRFVFQCRLVETGKDFTTEVIYFYHLRDGKIAEWWLLGDGDFDYKEKPKGAG